MVRILWVLSLTLTALSGVHSAPTIEKRQSTQWSSPPWYPTPKGGTEVSWAEAYQKAAALVSQMTLVEKVNITTGTGWEMGPCVGNTGPVPRLGFPSLCLQDGPLGVRYADLVTAWPAGITVASTWDKTLFAARGTAIGAEFNGKGVHIALGPCVGPLGRLPAGGRNWEGFGADPYLQGIASAEHVKGIQSQGVVATVKHFLGNEQEHFRQGTNAISTNIDDRTLHEMYLWPFQDSVKAGVGSIMCSYNKINNTSSCQNAYLINNVLKDILGFQGFIMSDWGAQYSGVASVLAGMDMTMPGDGLTWDGRNSLLGPELTKAVLNSSVPLTQLDDMVTRIIATYFKTGQDLAKGPNFSSWTNDTTGFVYWGSNQPPIGTINQHIDVRADHQALARKIAAESITLLKNSNPVLPLQKPMKIGVYGNDAGPGKSTTSACPDRGCNDGTLAMGWGSGTTEFEYIVTPLDAITAKAKSYGATVTSILDNSQTASMTTSGKQQDICLAFINSDSGEGYITWDGNEGDRNDLNAQLNGDAVVEAVAAGCSKVVVVVHSVGPIILEKWVRNQSVKAILWANLPGEESGNALVDVLWGDVNPSGKLPYTIAKQASDYGPTSGILLNGPSDGSSPQQDFSEGLYIDYRYFDKNEIVPQYEFGYGLSYTNFSYSELTTSFQAPISAFPAPRPSPEATPPVYHEDPPTVDESLFPAGFHQINRMIYPYLSSPGDVVVGPYPYPDGYNVTQTPSQAGGAEGGNPALWEIVASVSVDITNTGKVAGAEVPQLYVEYPTDMDIDFPIKQLRGFEKVSLEPGETQTVNFDLTRRDVSYWNTEAQNWEIPSAGIGVQVGSSSRQINARAWVIYDGDVQ